jgi:signal transduction histidine kinase
MVLSQINANTAEEKRQITLARLRIATHAGRIGIWEWNLRDSTLVWDKQMYETYRLIAGDAPPRYEMWRQRVHPQDIARVESQLNAAIAGTEDFNSEFRIVWPEGQERFLKAAASVVRDKQGRAVSLTGINFDISELKRVERMKSEFVSIVSHELRTPLTSIRGSLGLVANEAAGPVPDKVKEILALADRNAQRLGLLIDDLLDIEKLEAGKLRFHLEAQDLAPLIKQAISANVHYAVRSQVELAFSGTWPTAVVAVDGMRLLQVMTNLLSNAVKFSPTGSTVEISAFPVDDRRVRIAVRDRGRGIAPDFQPKVFSKFSQGDSSDVRAVGGTGLGLAISKALIEQMSGTIGFDTVPGNGTTFYFDLPLCDPASIGIQSQFTPTVSV